LAVSAGNTRAKSDNPVEADRSSASRKGAMKYSKACLKSGR